ncbi:hypothetical protein Vadar_025711 [Vaccinium darrowii]|uniref:Uncharacterized protein n=1 Tax=Vaccinium darrowii TaxID=229202 RepID=A0ACB7X3Q5_9ERIC|nr:hypothetical protein Vadar_025711 [Vaccinium darrowii]
MSPFLSRVHGFHTKSLSFYSSLIDHCISLKSLDFAKLTHAQLIKVGFNRHTFLGNRCIDLYSRLGAVSDALEAFDDITNKNTISWNICLRVYADCGNLENAHKVFEKMPERDIVSWNSIISGYASNGYFDNALETFRGMQNVGMRPNEFTFSIVASCVTSSYHGKQIHGSMIRSGVYLSNVVVGNSLINMYRTLGLVDYALGVFLTLEEVDVISWNSLILGCWKWGHGEMALHQFCLMVSIGYSPDEFTVSIVTSICTNLRDLEKGKQIFAFCIKLGFLSNTIVSSAAIDLFSKCNRLEDSIQLFEEIAIRDSAVCNSMISSYARHRFGEDALQLFVLTMRDNLKPTKFTLSSVLSSASSLLPADQGSQLHSLVVKLGMDSDAVVASSLVEMYAKYGLIDTSINIFCEIDQKDLISWNTMILGLTQNGRLAETLDLFQEQLKIGPQPDRITLVGVLLACCSGSFLDEGMRLFLSMEKAYGVVPRDEHYLCVVNMMIRAGKLKEAMDIVEAMPHEPSPVIWESILQGIGADGDLNFTERVADKLIDYDPHSSLPYLVLDRAYEMRGKWDSMVRVRKALKESSEKKVIGCSWIGIRNHTIVFQENHIPHYGDKDIYSMLTLLSSEMAIEGSVYDHCENVSRKGEERVVN